MAGLLERDYRLAIFDDASLQKIEVGPFAAGREDLEVRFAPGLCPVLTGRVVSGAGTPVERVAVTLKRRSFESALSLGGRVQSGSMVHDRAPVMTSADGHFALERVPLNGCELAVHRDGEHLLDVMLDEHDFDALEILVSLRCEVTVSLADVALADELAFLDEDGASLTIRVPVEGGHLQSQRVSLPEGRSSRLLVQDSARTLVLFAGNHEVRRIPVLLDPRRKNPLDL